ncbi:putative ArsR family transcriptional regulator [Murinocardiopsis flavida]|uniref:Putative ArsR family transcriptional regulator n=1 Tax=Murinocardiopsis flavida TaxID=645275 RepID=A0A2P8DQR7_9ACTN|nr:helix-turn-helix domain-containing protein [Murinocardiopsis flavida]PSK99540.1 putative ArsR family transcriptional regulator [Murinocardiopsis flavida]
MTESGISAVGALADPLRRALYEHIASQGSEVSRAEAARATGAARNLVGFHLDKLVEAGLLDVALRKVSGRDGPGSGRPAKLYRRADRQLSVHLPPRDYETAAHLMAAAVERHGADTALYASAREEGVRRGRALPAESGRAAVADAAAYLAAHGYEPAADPAEDPAGNRAGDTPGDPVPPAEIRLRNCPFHTLATAFPPLACGMNLELIRGLFEGAGITDATARMDAAPGRCCVLVSPTGGPSKTKNIDME